MVLWVEFRGRWMKVDRPSSVNDVKKQVISENNISDIYLTYNGKLLTGNATIDHGVIRATIRTLGGKGGFGSMLRAIGAQIEKTTNREACRDLSGRRLRDINEEKRLKNWIAQQAEREREAAERRQKKLERLCFEPKHDFQDQNYEKARTELTEKVHDAVEQGFRSACSSTNGLKRKTDAPKHSSSEKKKTCLWVDDVDEDDLSSLDSDSDSESKQLTEKKTGNKTNSSGNNYMNGKKMGKNVTNEVDSHSCSQSPDHGNKEEDEHLSTITKKAISDDTELTNKEASDAAISC